MFLLKNMKVSCRDSEGVELKEGVKHVKKMGEKKTIFARMKSSWIECLYRRMSKKHGQLLRRRGRIRPLAPQSCEKKKRKFQIIFARLKFGGMTVEMMRNKKTIIS